MDDWLTACWWPSLCSPLRRANRKMRIPWAVSSDSALSVWVPVSLLILHKAMLFVSCKALVLDMFGVVCVLLAGISFWRCLQHSSSCIASFCLFWCMWCLFFCRPVAVILCVCTLFFYLHLKRSQHILLFCSWKLII